jgi:thioesterase superfamily protein
MKIRQTDGPYRLVGFCFGGQVASEMCSELHLREQEVELAAMIYVSLKGSRRINWYGRRRKLQMYLEQWSWELIGGSLVSLVSWGRRLFLGAQQHEQIMPSKNYVSKRRDVAVPRKYPGWIYFFRPHVLEPEYDYDSDMGWNAVADKVEVFWLSGDRYTILYEPDVVELADKLQSCIDRLG